MHGEFTRNSDGIDREKSWSWLKNQVLASCTGVLVCTAQEQSLQNNYAKHYIDKTSDTLLCRLCGEMRENISQLVREYAKLVQRAYSRRHYNVEKYIRWLLAEMCRVERAIKWYEQKPEEVAENQDFKVL